MYRTSSALIPDPFVYSTSKYPLESHLSFYESNSARCISKALEARSKSGKSFSAESRTANGFLLIFNRLLSYSMLIFEN